MTTGGTYQFDEVHMQIEGYILVDRSTDPSPNQLPHHTKTSTWNHNSKNDNNQFFFLKKRETLILLLIAR